MIVLEGQQPLGDALTNTMPDLVRDLRNDPKHVRACAGSVG